MDNLLRALWTGASGMIAQQTNVDTIADNLANVNTTGFKSEKAEFKSLLYQTLQTKTTTANGNPKPVGAQVGLGVRNCSIDTSFEQGSMQESDSNTDFGISGKGFFAVRQENGEIAYTRNGNFKWALSGNGGMILTSSEGYPVLDTNGNSIRVPAGYQMSSVKFSKDGSLGYMNADNNWVDLGATIGLYQFNNPSGLTKLAGTYFQVSPASGVAQEENTIAQAQRSTLYQGYLESSNVQVADEMVNLIIAQRAYEMNSKAITTSDTMMEEANNLKR